MTSAADAEWVRSTVRRFERRLTLYAERFVGDADLARDVAQDTFLRLCREERAAVEHRLAEWLYTVCRNRALDVRRKERAMNRTSDMAAVGRADEHADPTARLEASDELARVRGLVERLPAKQREAIRLKFQHGLSYREIARITNTSIGNVGFLVHTGLKTLRERAASERLEGLAS